MSKSRSFGNISALRRASQSSAGFLGASDGRQFREIEIDQIDPNPRQPRRHFDPDALAELADSIDQNGVLEPILLLEKPGGRYELVAGERRWRACQIIEARRNERARQSGLGSELRMTVPALVGPVRDADGKDIDPMVVALLENLQRADLNPLELSMSLAALMEHHGWDQLRTAKWLGKSQSYVSKALHVRNLPPDILDELQANTAVSLTTIFEIAMAGDPALQRQLWTMAKAGASQQAIQAAKADGKRGRSANPAASAGSAPVAVRTSKAAARVLKEVRSLRGQGVVFEESQKVTLLALRDEIDALLAEAVEPGAAR